MIFCIRIYSRISRVDLFFAFLLGLQLNQGEKGVCLTGRWHLQTFSPGLKSCVLMLAMTRLRNWPEPSGLTSLPPAAWVTTLPLQKNNAIWVGVCVVETICPFHYGTALGKGDKQSLLFCVTWFEPVQDTLRKVRLIFLVKSYVKPLM